MSGTILVFLLFGHFFVGEPFYLPGVELRTVQGEQKQNLQN